MKFFSDIKPIIKAQKGEKLVFVPKDNLEVGRVEGANPVPINPVTPSGLFASLNNTTNSTENKTTTEVPKEEPKVKIYLSSDGTQHTNSINDPDHQKLIADGWTVVNSVPRGQFDGKKMGSYIPKDKWKGSPNFDVNDPGWGDKKDGDKKGMTFSDLRALNATAANKIERVPQGMPVSQMTRVDPLGRSGAIDKQKQDAQANANAARMRGPQGSDPTLNVLQNLGTTAQANEQTAKANMLQGENLSNQRDRQRQQVENANLIETNNQNVRIGLRNAQEKEIAGKKTQQRVAQAQIGNTWLGEKEIEQKQGIMSDAALVERYAQLAISKDPEFIKISKARAELTPKHLEAETNLKTAKYDLAVINSKLEDLEADDPSYASLQQKKTEAESQVQTFTNVFTPLKTEYDKLKARTEALRSRYEEKLIEYQRNVNRDSNQFGGGNTQKAYDQILDPLFNPNQTTKSTLKKGGSMTMADRLHLENVRQMNRIELQREKEMAKSFVLPEPKAYFNTMKMMMEQNKAVTDMVKDIYKVIYGGNKKR